MAKSNSDSVETVGGGIKYRILLDSFRHTLVRVECPKKFEKYSNSYLTGFEDGYCDKKRVLRFTTEEAAKAYIKGFQHAVLLIPDSPVKQFRKIGEWVRVDDSSGGVGSEPHLWNE
jgi:hypothetical protein